MIDGKGKGKREGKHINLKMNDFKSKTFFELKKVNKGEKEENINARATHNRVAGFGELGTRVVSARWRT